ncbi:hypothetical protein BBP40_002157, partial [Aspergillus hancockii]
MAYRPTQRGTGITPLYARLEVLRQKLERNLPSADHQTPPSKPPRGPVRFPDYPPEQSCPSDLEGNAVDDDEVLYAADPGGDGNDDDDAEWDIESPTEHYRGAEGIQPEEKPRLGGEFVSLLKISKNGFRGCLDADLTSEGHGYTSLEGQRGEPLEINTQAQMAGFYR